MTRIYSSALRFYTFLLVMILVIFALPDRVIGQDMLDQKVTLNFEKIRLADVLNDIENQGGFYFSYSGNLVSGDSVVSISTIAQPVYAVLEQLFHGKYEYEEENGYLIISAARPHLSIINSDMTNDRNVYSISGVVVNENTGERLVNVSVYAREQLSATLTDEHGYFKLRFKTDAGGTVNITASKLGYQNASLNFLHSVAIDRRTQMAEYKKAGQDTKGVERDAFGRFFISARQRVHSLNIPDFFAAQPFQFSLTPGLSTHGLMGAQVINEFSVNVAGGYTAGVNGIEIGGLFNINKGNSKYLQLAGIFNLVGGKVTGYQFAGVNNRVLDSVTGMQLSGFINKADGMVSGLQISALNNQAHQLKGVQIGLVNVVDSSQGASIGLINIIRNGFYKVSVSANNLTNTNIALSTGTHAFYSIFQLSANFERGEKLYAFGLGLGHDFMLGNSMYVAASADYQFAYTGSFDDRWARAKLLLNVKAGKKISVFAGPVLNRYTSNGSEEGYRSRFRRKESLADWHRDVHHWLGWELGVAFNSVFGKPAKASYTPESWYLGVAAVTGAGLAQPYGLITGGELLLERQFSGGISAILSAGYINNELRKRYPYSFTYGNIVPYQIINYRYHALRGIPVKAGMKTYTGSRLFFSAQIGFFTALNPTASRELFINGKTQLTDISSKEFSFLYSVSMGYNFKSGIEPGLMYQHGVDSRVQHIALRVAYRLKLGK
jgi:hypothetical protein